MLYFAEGNAVETRALRCSKEKIIFQKKNISQIKKNSNPVVRDKGNLNNIEKRK